MADSDLPEEDIDRLVQAIREQNGVENVSDLNFEEFYHMLSPQMDQLWNKSIDWKGKSKSIV